MNALPFNWAVATVGDTGQYINGMAFKPTDWGEHGLPIIRIQNLTDKAKALNKTTREVPLQYIVEKGDMLVSWSATLDAFIWDRERAVLNQHIFKVLPNNFVIDPAFLFHGLRVVIREMIGGENLHGSTMKHINRGPFLAHPFGLAPLPEQRRIAEKIDSLSAKSGRARAHLDHLPRLIEKYKQAVLAAAFRGELTKEWRAQHHLPEYRQVRLPELAAAPIRNGLSVKGNDAPPGVRALKLSALRSGTVDLSDVRFLPVTDERAERFRLAPGDVLISRGNGTKTFVGLAAIVGELAAPIIFPDTAFRLRVNQALARPSWIAKLWNSPQIRSQIEGCARTTAGIWKIAQYDLQQINLLLPHPAEQDEVARRIEVAFQWIDRLAAEATSARKLVDHLDLAVLAKAFRGELVPQYSADEPASALLERINTEHDTLLSGAHGRRRARKAV